MTNQSKLRNILAKHASYNKLEERYQTSEYREFIEETKSQIKSLMLDMVGEDDPIHTRANEIRKELRERIVEL